MANQIAGIRFCIIYKNGEENIADFISRTCIPNEIHNDSDENEVATYVNFLVTKMAPKSISLEDIKTETETDISLVAVKTALFSGKWYDNPILEPYRRFQNELTDHEGDYIKRNKNCFTKVSSKKSFTNCT